MAIPAPRAWPVRFGLAVLPDLTLDSDWRYFDQPGGLGRTSSYGQQDSRSRILTVRTTVGATVADSLACSGRECRRGLRPQFAPRALHFSKPARPRGFKTLLDLEADGYAAAFDFGAQFHPIEKLTLGVSYRPRAVVHTTGSASGNAAAQLQALGGGFEQVNPDFRYDAEVRTEVPQRITAGAEWQALDRLRIVVGIDWTDWADAFDQLEIHLKNGSNPAINGVVGSADLTDIVPLRRRDQFVYRAGFEFAVTEMLSARAGFSYARSPVPNETLTPLTGAIFEPSISAGLGYRWGHFRTDFAWQGRLPVTQRVGRSALLAGEFSQTSLTLNAHLLQLTTGVEF
ncbi:MAG: outer membrane protein transport protein [Chthoniobacterales bacterium]